MVIGGGAAGEQCKRRVLKGHFWPVYFSNCGKNYIFGNSIKNQSY